MVRTKQTARKGAGHHAPRKQLAVPMYLWTSSQCAGSALKRIVTGAAREERPSAFERMLEELSFDARVQLAGALVEGLDVCLGSQLALAAGRQSCKALRGVIDDGLQPALPSLRLNVLPDKLQGPPPCLSRFPNVTSLTLSIDADWDEPGTDGSGSSCDPLLGERPAPSFKCRFAGHAYPPSPLLKPLHGQPLACRQRLRTLTIVGQLTSFEAFCTELPAALTTANAADKANAAANAAGSEEGGSGRAGVGCLAHLDLGNVRFPLRAAGPGSVTRGHAALGPLGLRELTLGVELLPGVQAHKELRRLHLYSRQASFEVQRLIADSAWRLQQLPLQHVSLLGHGWEDADAVALLNALPDTVTSVYIGDICAGLRLGQDDRGQATRELVLWDVDEARRAVGVLSAWPRGLPQAARLTLVEVGSISGTAVDKLEDLLTLLGRVERVQCHTVKGRCTDLLGLIPLLPTAPGKVLLEVPFEGDQQSSMTLRLVVGAEPSGGGGRGSGQGTSMGDGGEGCAQAGGGVGQQQPREAGGAGIQLPTAEGLLARALQAMEARALSKEEEEEDEEQEEEEEEEGEEQEEEGEDEEAAWGVLLLAGPGVSAVAVHTAEGETVLECALAELQRTYRDGNQYSEHGPWEYVVLPGDGFILLCWNGGEVVEAAVQAVRGAAEKALGRGVPAEDVRAVALPHCSFESAWEELSACAREVLQSEVRLRGGCADLLGQLQAVAELWDELQAVWDSPYCAARPVPVPVPVPAPAPEAMEEDAGPGPSSHPGLGS